ncbi:hypothetical protein SAMN05880574_12629 [Chryseobacterium sp. RU37D]|nr:hypothetical protein SAMN05880574_12629 [Chryseobacterium sp. RU37D]
MIFSCQAQQENKYLEQVGDTQYNSKIDDPNFKVCNPNKSFQYYNIFQSNGVQYKGEKYAILKLWGETYNPNLYISEKTGYITIRFLVNCEGKTGLFRIQQMDENYLETSFNENLVKKVLNFVKSLDEWAKVESKEKKIDYYQYLTFKIENGIVKEILP